MKVCYDKCILNFRDCRIVPTLYTTSDSYSDNFGLNGKVYFGAWRVV
jgi:hypothetical protein